MKIGITGTRKGMTAWQEKNLIDFLFNNPSFSIEEIHHGDCVGVDEEVCDIARLNGLRTVCHPPEDETLRAFTDNDIFHAAKPYFARNRNIVNDCDILLVFPYESSHQYRGGTWYTHDYALKVGKTVKVFWPEP